MDEAEIRSKDLLRRFAGVASISENAPETSGDDVELSLSLGGSFSSNPRDKSKLIRSSSISAFPFAISREEGVVGPATQLQRTCSLPLQLHVAVVGDGDGEEEEEYRKRKEMQSLKRLEAKRKRCEKRVGAAAVDGIGNEWAAARLPPISQGSIGSVGSSSTSARSMIGFDITRLNNSTAKAKSSSIPNLTNYRTSIEKIVPKKLEGKQSAPSEMERSMMEEMPCVSTRGLGPNGKKIEGFLYKYRKGEEVRIVCVCHGSFLTPAEFVRHAGGGDVDHPLRHIVVSSSPSPFL